MAWMRNFGSDSGSSAEASHLPACVTSLDFNGDDALNLSDVTQEAKFALITGLCK